MNAEGWMQRFRKEGERHVNVSEEAPGGFYPDHAYRGATAHVILSGE